MIDWFIYLIAVFRYTQKHFTDTTAVSFVMGEKGPEL